MQTATNQQLKASRGCVIVKPVSTEERRAGSSIILLEDTREKLASHQMLVVSVGEPEACEDWRHLEDCEHQEHEWRVGPLYHDGEHWTHIPSVIAHPTDKRIKPDAWVLVRPRSLVEISSADKLYSCKISDVVGVFSDTLTDSAA